MSLLAGRAVVVAGVLGGLALDLRRVIHSVDRTLRPLLGGLLRGGAVGRAALRFGGLGFGRALQQRIALELVVHVGRQDPDSTAAAA